jgi:hypothetical protein
LVIMSCRGVVALEYFFYSVNSGPCSRVDRPERVALQQIVHMDGQEARRIGRDRKFATNPALDLFKHLFDVDLEFYKGNEKVVY